MPIVNVPGVGRVRFPDSMSQEQIITAIETDILKKPEASSGEGSWFGDVGRSFAQGVVGAGKSLVDVFGAETAPSQYLEGVQQQLQQGLTSERQAEIQRRRQLEEEASKSGSILNEIGTFLGGVAEAPVQSLAQGLGSVVPFVGTGIVGGVAKLLPTTVRALNTVVGAAMGAGSVKGSLYDNVEAELRKQGVAPDIAKAQAQQAQSYLGENFLSIVGGSALGAVGARTGVERLLTKEGKEAAAAGVGRRVGKAVLEEAPVEAAQAGQEQLAVNLALQRQGIDVDTFRGVAGAAARDAAIGALTAGAVGAVRGPEAQPPTPAPEAEAAPEAPPAPPEAPLTPEEQAKRDIEAKLSGFEFDALSKAAQTGTVTIDEAPAAAAPAAVTPAAVTPAVAATTTLPPEYTQAIDVAKKLNIEAQIIGLSKQGINKDLAAKIILENDKTGLLNDVIAESGLSLTDIVRKVRRANGVFVGKDDEGNFKKDLTDAEPVVGGEPAAGESERRDVSGAGVDVPVLQPPTGTPATFETGLGGLDVAKGPAATAVTGEGQPAGALDENQRRIQFLEEEIPRLQQTLADKEARRTTEKDGRKTKITKNETALRNYLKAFQQELTERKEAETASEAKQDLTTEEQAALQAELQAELAGETPAVETPAVEAPAKKRGRKAPVEEVTEDEALEAVTTQSADFSDIANAVKIIDGTKDQRKYKEAIRYLIATANDTNDVSKGARQAAELALNRIPEADRQAATQELVQLAETRKNQQLRNVAGKIQKLDGRIQQLTDEYKDAKKTGDADALTDIKNKLDQLTEERKGLKKEQRTVEKTEVLLRRAAGGVKGMGLPEVQRIVDRIKAKWKGAPKIEVAASYDVLPRPIREFLTANDAEDARGVFYTPTQTVYIIAANNDTEASVAHTLAHETIGHFGLRKVLGDKYTGMMNLAYMNPAVKALADNYIEQNPGTSKAVAVEEALAELVELGQADSGRVKQLMNRIVSMVRQFLRFITNNRIADQFSDSEVRDLLSSARNIVEEGGVSTTTADTTAPMALLSRQERETKAALQTARTPQEELDELKKGIKKKYEDGLAKASLYKKARSLFFSYEGWTELVRRFQNDRVIAKRLEDRLDKTGMLKSIGKELNNVYNQLTRASSIADEKFNEYVYFPVKDLEKATLDYVKASGLELEDALQQLHFYSIGLHEQERRRVKYIRTVPLDDNVKIEVKELGVTDTPANIRARIYQTLSRNVDLVKSKEAKFLRNLLETIVEKYKKENGNSLNGYKSTDINSAEYDVIAEMTQPAVDLIRTQLENDPNKELVYAILGDPKKSKNDGILKELHDGTTELNKQANYWTQPVSNFVEFYGYKNYVPFKGRPEPRAGANEEYGREAYDDPNSKRFSGDFVDAAQSFEGRTSISENPLLQSMADAARASLRVARKDVTLAVKNLVTDKNNPTGEPLVKGELVATIKFDDRDKESFKQYSGNNFIYHYNSDGSIDILKLADTNLVEAVRKSFRKSQPLTELLNAGTSLMGQFHTRYNPAFAPMNFVRDALTNAFIMGADLGGKATYDYLGAVSKQVASGGMYKVGKIAKLYSQRKLKEIKRMVAEDPSGFVADVLEYIQAGGRVTYVQSITAMGQMDELVKDIGRSKLIRGKEQIDKWVDVWTDTFELTSRAAAYSIVKKQLMANKVPEEEAKVRASAYAKNLANFEQVGEWGKQAGALFMFFRPAATGAVRATESLLPMFQRVETAIRRLPENLRTEKIDAAIKAQTAAYNRAISDGDASAAAGAQKQLDSLAARRQNILQAQAKFRENHARQQQTARRMVAGLLGAGATLYTMAWMMSDDDEMGRNRVATDNMKQWTRYLRLPVPENKYGVDYLQVPWAFGFGAFGAAGAQFAGAALGKTSIGDMLVNVMTIGMDSFLPIPVSRMSPVDSPLAWFLDSVAPSPLRPFLEYTMNTDGLGREIYNNRQTRIGNAYTGGDNIPEGYKDAAITLFEATRGAINISPNTIYFFANNYIDGLSRIGHNLYNVGLVMGGKKDFDFKTDTMLFDSFVGKASSFDAREFAAVESKIKARIQRMDTLLQKSPEKYAEYLEDYPLDPALKEIYNKTVGGSLKKLNETAKSVRNMGLDPKERKKVLDEIKLAQNLLKRALIDTFEAYDIHP